MTGAGTPPDPGARALARTRALRESPRMHPSQWPAWADWSEAAAVSPWTAGLEEHLECADALPAWLGAQFAATDIAVAAA